MKNNFLSDDILDMPMNSVDHVQEKRSPSKNKKRSVVSHQAFVNRHFTSKETVFKEKAIKSFGETALPRGK